MRSGTSIGDNGGMKQELAMLKPPEFDDEIDEEELRREEEELLARVAGKAKPAAAPPRMVLPAALFPAPFLPRRTSRISGRRGGGANKMHKKGCGCEQVPNIQAFSNEVI